MTTTQLPKTQVAIIGAGVGGCIAALALAPYYCVTLIDKEAAPINKIGESLAPAALRILTQLKLAHLLNDTRHIVSHGTLSYWGSSEPTLIDNLRNPDGFGWHLDRSYFETQLRNACIDAKIHCIWPAQLTDSVATDEGWQLSLQHDNSPLQLNANTVIDASGRHCAFARQQGITRQQFDKLMSIGFTANVNIKKKTALISHTDEGWWYSAPIHNPEKSPTQAQQKRVFSWYADAKLIKNARITDPSQLLNRAKSIPGFTILSSRIEEKNAQLYPLVAANSSKLVNCSGKNWFALGDAALSFDPLSSQGMFNAMACAIQLSELLINNGLMHAENIPLYQQQVDKIWLSYLAHRALYYKMVS
ncbi:NAD(P)/FAD-dependent oxidoreductase [Pseudoalteromonas sp. MMG012]|uniref:NAD(P)/FAD-dependent oxidoreductase n=1 Tax=Pseudoalteromonas sp. MMG012 TaxID=2822686 RepID=UPI001B3A0816|nr:tryptophan 7-halogenase [Pseudoalteromonas sp. MMG012]MBQ4850228.1 tryptophan 7-halogenase [Pseudoalteromonas sp. MMG012]